MTWTVFCPCGIRTRFSIVDAAELVSPHRQPELEPELDQVLEPVGGVRARHGVLVAEPGDASRPAGGPARAGDSA